MNQRLFNLLIKGKASQMVKIGSNELQRFLFSAR